ncbi:MAG TPA: hypothetical protein VG253_05235 [Streptosporangiaceae bacterium]|nr:hypothetical protein [Streptosporangiaceae bacterium]
MFTVRRPGAKWLGAVAAGIVLLLDGCRDRQRASASNARALSAATRTEADQRAANSALQAQVSSLRAQVSTLQGQLSSAQGQLSSAQSQAQHATATANARASAAYAARNAALTQQEATLKQQEKTVAAETGQLQANQISGDGVYVVGKDIKAGTWHTNGSGKTGQNDCYFATLNSTDTTNIADNNNFDGAETVDVSSAYAFQVSGPCTWVRVG